jgi:hypothetical protein
MNAPLRISATLLESFRLYLKADWFNEEDLIAQIQGVFTPTPQIRLGKAYHACVEKPQLSLSGIYEKDGYRFEPEAIEGMRRRIVPGLFEVKTTKLLRIADEDVTLVARCDHIIGSHLDEFKTSTQFDADKYLASIQWRLMMWLFDTTSLTYHVATLDEDEHDNVVRLKGLESLNVFPYPQLRDDCCELIRELCSYLRAKGLEGYLRKQPQAGQVVA